MKTDFATCSFDDLSTATGGYTPGQPHWDSDLSKVPASAYKPSGYTRGRNPLFQWGKPDHPTPLPTVYFDARPPFVHIH